MILPALAGGGLPVPSLTVQGMLPGFTVGPLTCLPEPSAFAILVVCAVLLGLRQGRRKFTRA